MNKINLNKSSDSLQQAIAEFNNLWNNNTEFYKISTAFYQLNSLTSEPEMQIIEENLSKFEHRQQKFNRLLQIKQFVCKYVRAVLCILVLILAAFNFFYESNENIGKIVAFLGILIFSILISTIAIVFHTWNTEKLIKSEFLPEKVAINEAIESLYKKFIGEEL